jgi:hypothetical protein
VSASAPKSSAALALEVEELLEGRGFVRKSASGGLLTGLGARLTRASALSSRAGARESLSTGVDALDRLLSGGLPRGGFVEVVARRSSGRFSLAIAALASATSCGETAALVDVGGHLDPQSAEEAGVDLQRLLWVRPEKLKHAVAAAEMLLATGFALVVVDLGVPPVRGRFVPDAAWVRLERAARDRGAALLLLSPYRVGGTAEAVVALDSAHPVWRGERRAPAMLSGIGARMTLQKDASAREGARGELRLTVDPMLFGIAAHSALPLAVKEGPGEERSASSTVVRAARAAAPSHTGTQGVSPSSPCSSLNPPLPGGEGRGGGRPDSDSQSVIPSGARDPFPTDPETSQGSLVARAPRDDRGKESLVARAPHNDEESGAVLPRVARREDGGETTSPLTLHPLPPLRVGRGDVKAFDAAETDFPRNSSPKKSVLPHGDGMVPFDPPSPIPGEGGIFFRPPAPAPAHAQLPLLP